MRIYSSSNLLVESPPNPSTSNLKRRNRRRSKQPFILKESPVDTMADQRTMATTNLRNEISNFQQRFDESFHEAWDRYKDLLRACPRHGFTELHQLDTFYNALNPADQDSSNSTAGGNLLERRTQDVLTIIENKSKVRNSRNKSIVSQVKSSDANSNSSSEISKLTHAVNQKTSVVTIAMTAIIKQSSPSSSFCKSPPPPASVKAVEEICVTVVVLIRIISVSPPVTTLSQNLRIIFKDTLQQPHGIVLDGPSVPIPSPFINLDEDERVEETLTDQDLAEYTIKVPPPLVQKPKPPSQRNFVVHQRDPLHPYPDLSFQQFITEIENLKDLKVKIIKCDNGGEFINKEMNDFCSQKGIKREFSNARTPQRNGVAERRNKTLIEAARTMMADAKLPLFNGRTPAIGNLKPFGCHVMILNTLNNLGRFKAKGDESYFIGYSMSSKAFRVFNKRTRKVEENLHVEFIENKAIKKGAGPNWLFDIDSLTKSMNYVPVDAGIISTNLSGTKDAAKQEVKKDVSSLRYISLPNWIHDALLESSLMETPIPTVSSPVPTACLNDSLEPSSDTRLSSKRVVNQEETPSLYNILTLTNQFLDILGVITNSVDSDGVEADVSNIEISITASPTPTLRIHKDHPKSQIIGHMDTLIQTRNKSKETLVDYPKEVRPIETKWVLKNKKDERGIFIRNKSRLLAQGYTQEEGINYDEVFVPVARIEAIRLFLAYASFMGFTDPEFPAKVYKVEKAIYGLHQAPRAWYDVRSSNTPMDKENPWGKDRTGKDVDLHLYRSMIGSLMYLTASRPDIMFDVCACVRH
nr:hypothetical protein [Tanacetum cinerariifolium]